MEKEILKEENQNTENMTEEERLTYEREKLVKMIKARTPKSVYEVAGETIENSVQTLSESDCRAMYEIVKKKGIVGLMAACAKQKKKLKKELKKDPSLQEQVEKVKEFAPEIADRKEDILD